MTAAQYHAILTPLTEAERLFEENSSTWTAEDEKLYHALRLIRSEVLKRESGHPFPNITPSRAIARVVSPNLAISQGASGADAGAPASPIRVLVVDDDAQMRDVVKLLLGDQPDIEVVAEAQNGTEAIAAAERCRPDVILMDLNMPVLGGIEATRAIRRFDPAARIVIFTGNTDRLSCERAFDVGAVGLLMKPAEKDMLLGMIRDASAKRRCLGELRAFVQSSSEVAR